ncbi:MAG: DUF819 family protein [Gammaproteobacteria bacterium]|nr:DUF819 family protein [Gammaproteobacteria bacterium]
MSLIPADNSLTLAAILLALAWLGFWIDTKPIGRKTSGVIWVLGVGVLLSNFKVIPYEAPVYGFVGGTLMPLAIPLLLFKADLRRIFRESGKVMFTFLIASAATVAGAIIGFFLLDLGDIGPKVAGAYTGGWIGGAVNLVAVSESVKMTPTEASLVLSASNPVSMTALALLLAITSVSWFSRFIPTAFGDDINEEERKKLGASDAPALIPSHVTGVLALSLGVCALAGYIGDLTGTRDYNILTITVVALIVANVIPGILRRVEGEFELGMMLMYIFFAMIGAGTNATIFLESAVILFVFGMMMIFIHLAIVLAAAKLLKIDLAEAVVGSGAALVGPAVTAAIAISKGWRPLVTPAIMCGVFGYAIGTFIGYAVAMLLSGGTL